jgi:hypothetical protein
MSMNRQTRWAALLLACVMGFVPGLLAQPASNQAVQKSPLPMPVQILKGKKVFISNDREALFNEEVSYSGGPDRAYSQFYSGLKAWDRYAIVSEPSEADLILEIRLIDPHEASERRETPDQFQLTILDPKTHVLLWKLYQKIEPSGSLEKRDKNFDQAMPGLIDQLNKLAEAAPALQEQ